MTDLLTKAFKKASQLPAEQQDQLARELIAELEGDQLWEASFARSQDQLEQLARKALQEHEAGKIWASTSFEIAADP